jgi:hypothetical protein
MKEISGPVKMNVDGLPYNIRQAANGRQGGSMPVSSENRKYAVAAHWLSLAVAASCICLQGFVGISRVGGQTMQMLSRSITISSDPAGATIWTKEGRLYTCTNALTPATFELKFHGENDAKQILLRRFGYANQQLLLDAAHDKAAAKLVAWGAPFFTPPDDASPEVRSLDASLKKEFEKAPIPGNDAFPCAPFEFQSIGVVKSDERHELELGVLITLGPSAAAKNLNAARRSHGNPEERLGKMGQAALEGGVAEIIASFRDVAAKFPEIKGIFLACSYPTTEAVLDAEYRYQPGTTTTTTMSHLPGPGDSTYSVGHTMDTDIVVCTSCTTTTTSTTPSRWVPYTVVKDQAAVRTLTFAIPLAKIPATADKKAVTEAVLADGAIRDF